MTKYILIGGRIHKAKDGGKAFCDELINGFNKKTIKILDCMFAQSEDLWDKKIQDDDIFFSKFIKNYKLELALPEKFLAQVKSSDIIFFKGGSTRLLMNVLSKNLDFIKKIEGKVVIGSSAGADILAKYYAVGKTGRFNGLGLGLLPIKFIPHYGSDYGEYANADWKGVLKSLKNYKENLPVYNLKEGEYKVFIQ